MSEEPHQDDEAKFNEAVKRLLKTPPKPHSAKDTQPAKKKPGSIQGGKLPGSGSAS